MTVQTIPAIKDMTPAQRADLMEELWDSMIRSARRVPSIEWHREILDDGVRIFEDGEQGYRDWEEAKSLIVKRGI